MSAAGPPGSPAGRRPGAASPPARFALGDLRCEVLSADARYPAMLAAAYGAAVMADSGAPPPSPDLAIAIRDEPTAAASPRADRLIVTRMPGFVRLESDPMTWRVQLDARPRQISVAVHDPGMPADQLAYHFWILLNRALLLMGRVTLHAAALSYRGSVSLFAGPKGAGKSTIAVALSRAGAALLADDHVVARRAGGRLAASGCAGRLRVTAKTEGHFLPGALGPETLEISGVPKKEFPAGRFFTTRPHEEHVVDRLFLPRVGERFAIRPARRQAALLRLVEETGAMLRFHARADYADFLAALAALVAAVPCHDLELSPRLADLDRLVAFLDEQA